MCGEVVRVVATTRLDNELAMEIAFENSKARTVPSTEMSKAATSSRTGAGITDESAGQLASKDVAHWCSNILPFTVSCAHTMALTHTKGSS